MALFKKQQPAERRGTKTYNRTPVTTYYRSKKQPANLSPFKKKEPKSNTRKYFFGAADIVLILILLAALVYSLLLNSNPKVEVSDQSYRSLASYNSQIKSAFSGIANSNKLTFDNQAAAAKIQDLFPEVQTSLIELPVFSEQPKVNLVVSPPAFKYASAGKVFVVDSKGVAVQPASNAKAQATLVTVTDQTGFTASAGKQVLSGKQAAFIATLISQLKHAKVPISSLTLPPVAQEVDLRTTDQPYFTKFYLDGDANLQAGQLLAARQKFAQDHINPSQYLDARVEGKIFYK